MRGAAGPADLVRTQLQLELRGLRTAYAEACAALDDARRAGEEARGAGIQVIMITGDHPATALAIAHAAGIDVASGVTTGAALSELPFSSLRQRMRQFVFELVRKRQIPVLMVTHDESDVADPAHVTHL